MSKQSYLLTILFICVVGYILISQMMVATRSSDNLLGDEILRKVEIQINRVCDQLKRFPDSGTEFKTLVLGGMEWQKYRRKISLERFFPGNPLAPAFFQFKIEAATDLTPSMISMKYYGSDYQANIKLKGKLLKQ